MKGAQLKLVELRDGRTAKKSKVGGAGWLLNEPFRWATKASLFLGVSFHDYFMAVSEGAIRTKIHSLH